MTTMPYINDDFALNGEAPEPQLGITEEIRRMLQKIGEDPDREGLLKTPLRVDRSMAYLTSGYRADPQEVVNSALFHEDVDDMVIVRDVEFYSLCEHHMLPFFGEAHVAYIPKGKIIGLSKIPRIVEIFSRRLQVQERMTRQIAQCLMEHLGARGVAVVTEARHLCMMMRGVEKQQSSTLSSCMLGAFRTHVETRQEFLQIIGNQLR